LKEEKDFSVLKAAAAVREKSFLLQIDELEEAVYRLRNRSWLDRLLKR
jgi:hypothetical protein